MTTRTLPRIRLRIGIAVMFLGIMLPLTALMTGVLYRQNSKLAYDMATAAMERSTQDIVVGVKSVLGPIGRVVDLSVAFGKAERENLRRPESLRPLLEELEQLPDLYSLYFGLARDGAFYQVVRLPPGIAKYGHKGNKPPEDAKFALRILDSAAGEPTDSYIYIAKWGEVVGVERADKVSYDPRKRPWYDAASKNAGIASSGVYIFSGTGRPGLTLSRRLATDDNETIGVFGADLSIETLSHFLDNRRVGDSGEVFILDEDQRLIGYPHPEVAITIEDNKAVVAKAEAVSNHVVADAVKLHNAGRGDHFRATLGQDGETYLVSFTPFPEDFGKKWVIGNIVAESEFNAPLRRASLIIVVIGSLFLGLASFAVLWASRLLTRPILQLTAQTERVRRLDLDEDDTVHSAVAEIHDLAGAVTTMKTALRSFGTYVPKDLVRGIVESGLATEVGGERRAITVLFTDLAQFTRTSEALAPEQVLERLSTYFQAMSQTIDASGGIVDKFIGDGIMALWNAPALHEDHAARACRAVLAARQAGSQLNSWLAAEGGTLLRTRFGLHTGIAVVGNVGSKERMQYTAMGASVNLASRIEGLNKYFGTECLVSGAVEEAVRGQFRFRPLGSVMPSGISVPLPLFELIEEIGEGEIAEAFCAAWAKAYDCVQARDWAGAVAGFKAFLADHPEDGPARLLLAHAEDCARHPPAAGWDGTLRFDDK